MKVGVTGTREGTTRGQDESFGKLLCRIDRENSLVEFHHGSCQGVDVRAAWMVRQLIGNGVKIVCHPGPDDDMHRQCSHVDDETLPPKNHFARNRDIVNAVDLLIVIPKENEWMPRGGTWYTAGVAVKQRKPYVVIWPDGSVERSEDGVSMHEG